MYISQQRGCSRRRGGRRVKVQGLVTCCLSLAPPSLAKDPGGLPPVMKDSCRCFVFTYYEIPSSTWVPRS